MKLLFTLSLLVCATTLPAAHLDDPGKLLPVEAIKAFETKLALFERSSGIGILVRFQAKSPTEEEDKVPGDYMRALAARLGTLKHGVLVVYFADDPDWRVWIGDELTSTFVGKPGTVKELTDSGAIHDVKEAMLSAARAKADAAFAAQQDNTSATKPAAGRHLVLQTDALLDALIGKFPPMVK